MRERVFLVTALAFLALWIISELEERVDRAAWQARLDQFINAKGPGAGNRFTAEDGQELRDRIDEVARECEERKECENE